MQIRIISISPYAKKIDKVCQNTCTNWMTDLHIRGKFVTPGQGFKTFKGREMTKTPWLIPLYRDTRCIVNCISARTCCWINSLIDRDLWSCDIFIIRPESPVLRIILLFFLTHLPLVWHIGSGNDLSPVWHQAITWTKLTYCHLDPQEQTSVKFALKYKTFHSSNIIWKCRLRNGGHFVQKKMS